MKKFFKKLLIFTTIILIIIVGLFFFINDYLMPHYVDSPQVKVPNLIGRNKDEAVKILKAEKLNPIIQGVKYTVKFPKDVVMFQNPKPNSTVKIKRRIYLLISGGEPKIKMPNLVGKTLRDSKITLERLGLAVHNVKKVRSEFPRDIVVEQEFPEGTNLFKGDSVDISVSVGPKLGMIRTPNLLGKSLKRARRILRRNSLKLGKITYQSSPNLLPNTVIDQYPTENKLLSIGDSVDVVVTRGF